MLASLRRQYELVLLLVKAAEVEFFNILLAVGILAIIFAIAGFCEMVGER